MEPNAENPSFPNGAMILYRENLEKYKTLAIGIVNDDDKDDVDKYCDEFFYFWRKDRDEEWDYVHTVLLPEFQRENPNMSFKESKMSMILSGSIHFRLYNGVESAVAVVNDIFVMIDEYYYRRKDEKLMKSQITKALLYFNLD